MNNVAELIASACLGLLSGIGSVLALSGLVTNQGHLAESIEINGWRSLWAIGTEAESPYSKIWVARNGLFALRREEAVYFIINQDRVGERLREECDYRLDVPSLPAAWWSVTVYNARNFLPQNDDRRFSFDATRAETLQTKSILLSARPPTHDLPWISLNNAGAFDVTLRLYQPDETVLSDPVTALTLPPLNKLGCKG